MIESEGIEKEARHHHVHNQDRGVRDREDRDRCRISTKTGEMMADPQGETMEDPPGETRTERTTAIGTTNQVVALGVEET